MLSSPTPPKSPDRKDPVPRSERPLSLHKMAGNVLAFITEHDSTTFHDVADIMVRHLDEHDQQSSRTLRRRVYDVLNVFMAAGFITKTGKGGQSIRLLRARTGVLSSPYQNSETDNIMKRQTELAEKIKRLVLTKLLIERNRGKPKVDGAIVLHKVMFLAFRAGDGGTYQRQINGMGLEISAQNTPLFASPMNVLNGLMFQRKEEFEGLRRYEELAPMLPVIYPEFV